MVSQIDMRGEVTINSQIYVRPRSAGNLAVHRELADDIAMTVDALTPMAPGHHNHRDD